MENCIPEAPSLMDTMHDNSNLIMECLEISDSISTQLTTDHKINDTSREVNCMMAEAINQNENLKMLADTLKFIKANMFN